MEQQKEQNISKKNLTENIFLRAQMLGVDLKSHIDFATFWIMLQHNLEFRITKIELIRSATLIWVSRDYYGLLISSQVSHSFT